MVGYAFMSHVKLNGQNDRSDAGNIADNLGGPVFVWGIVITVLALAMLGAGLWWAWRRPARSARLLALVERGAPARQLRLEARVPRLVDPLADERVGQVVLGDVVALEVVRVLVALAVAERAPGGVRCRAAASRARAARRAP